MVVEHPISVSQKLGMVDLIGIDMAIRLRVPVALVGTSTN